MSSKIGVWQQDSPRDAFALGTPPAKDLGAASEKSAAIDLASLLRRCLDDNTFCGMILHKFASRSANQLAALERCKAWRPIFPPPCCERGPKSWKWPPAKTICRALAARSIRPEPKSRAARR
jgi:hypothetical protein